MPRPFPFAVNIGTDICHIPRIQSIIRRADGRYAQRLVNKILNGRERKAHESKLMVIRRRDLMDHFHEGTTKSHLDTKDMDQKIRALAVFLSGRWAAKEATIKAHTSHRLMMHDITILPGKISRGSSTAPVATVRTRRGEVEKEQIVKISISHDGDYATAVCLAAGDIDGDLHEMEAGLGVHIKEDVIADLIREGEGVGTPISSGAKAVHD